MKALFAAVVVLLSARAHATNLDLEIGQCRFEIERDGVFYQNDRHHNNYLTPRCAMLSVTGAFNDRIGWRVGVLATSNIETRTNIATLRDDEIGIHGMTCQADGHGCEATHRGAGSVRGIVLGLTDDLPITGLWHLSPEFGLLLYESKYNNDARYYDGARQGQDAGGFAGGQRRDIFSALPSPYGGLTLRYGAVFVSARTYFAQGHRNLSLTNNNFTQLSAGLRFSF